MEKKTGVLLKCRDVHGLVSQGLDRDLSLAERTKMRMHFMICASCTNFNAQMQLLRNAMHKLPLGDDEVAKEEVRK